jgi:hypothetical protein
MTTECAMTVLTMITLVCSCSDQPKTKPPLHELQREHTPPAEQNPSRITPPDQARRAEVGTPPAPSAPHAWVAPKPKDIPWPLVSRPEWLSGKLPRDFRIEIHSLGVGGSSRFDLRVTGQSEFAPKRRGDGWSRVPRWTNFGKRCPRSTC